MRVLSAAVLLAMLPISLQAATDCAPNEGLFFVCGGGAIEDLAPVPGTRFLLAGAMRFSDPAPIRLLDTSSGTFTVAWPNAQGIRQQRNLYADCPAPPDPRRLSVTGVALQPVSRNLARFLAVNEGDRRAIEVFDVQLVPEQPDDLPQLQWIGCIPMPAGTNPNGVTPLDGDAVAIVSMDDGSPQRMQRHVEGAALGSVWIWRPVAGLRRLPGLQLRGGNGIAASPDHRWLVVSAWSGAQLLRITVDGRTEPQVISLPFLPDNVKLAIDGSLLIAAQRPPVSRIALCTAPACPADWLIARMDPATLQWKTLHEARGSATLNYATGAVEFAGKIWISNRGTEGIAVLPASRSTLPGQ